MMKRIVLWAMTVLSLILIVLACGKDDGPDAPEAKAPDVVSHTESGAVGSTLIINGTNFGATIAENTVTLNGVAVTLSAANTIKLTGTVPANATTGKITVTTAGGSDTSDNDFVVNNQAPSITQNQVFSVYEDVSDTFEIGTVEAVDPEGEDLTFSLITVSDLFEISKDGAISLQHGESLDYESAESYELLVKVSDDEDADQQTINIQVLNVIETLFEDPDSFITTWTTAETNEIVVIGTVEGLSYNYEIDWGDGTQEFITSSAHANHSYLQEGEHKIAIKGKFPQINMFGLFEQFRLKITSIDQWGAIEWKSFKQAFMGCFNLEYNAKDIPNLTQVSDLSYMFAEATIFNGDLSNWETGNVTTIAAMFRNATLFNGNIGGWDVQNVEIMSEVFSGAGKFDQNLGEWKIKSLLEGGSMFNFLNNSGLSPENYANTIIGWANQENVPSNITFGMDGMGHCDEEAYNAQVYLESEKGWTFVGEDNGC